MAVLCPSILPPSKFSAEEKLKLKLKLKVISKIDGCKWREIFMQPVRAFQLNWNVTPIPRGVGLGKVKKKSRW